MTNVYKVHYVGGGSAQKSWPRVYENQAGAVAAMRYLQKCIDNLRDHNVRYGYLSSGYETFMEVAERSDWVRVP